MNIPKNPRHPKPAILKLNPCHCVHHLPLWTQSGTQSSTNKGGGKLALTDYFGHNESYILDQSKKAIFASIAEERFSPDVYDNRADVIVPLVMQLCSTMANVSESAENPYEELAKVSVVAPLRFDTGAAVSAAVEKSRLRTDGSSDI